MRSLLKTYLLNAFTLWLVASFVAGVNYSHHAPTIFAAALVLSLLNATVKPILNILFIPINFMSLGLLRWVTTVIVIYLVTITVADFHIGPFTIASFTFLGVIFPSVYLGRLTSLIAVSFTISATNNLLHWIFKSEQ